MKNILVLPITLFICFNICAQSVQLDSIISYRDTLSEMPFTKRIYQYNNEGTHTKTIAWNTTSSNGVVMYGITQMDSFYYNEQGLLDKVSVFGLHNGVYVETIRTILEYDDDGNNTKYKSQGKNDMSNDWYDLWVWTNVFENGLNVESILTFKNPNTGISTRLNREEYIYDPNTDLLIENNSFEYDVVTSEEYPTTRRVFFHDADGLIERSDRYSYNENSSAFELNSIANYKNDDFGNNLSRTSLRIDSNGVETLSFRTTNVYNTNIENSQTDLPVNNFIQFVNNKHITLHSTSESWEDEEWKINSKSVYHYSDLTGTDDVTNVKELILFPNPAMSTLNFENMELLETGASIQFMKIDGSEVFNGKLNDSQINIEHLSKGFYNIILKNDGMYFKGKVIKI